MDIQTKDGILLRGIPDGTPDEAIKARIAQIRSGAPKQSFQPPTPYTPSGERPNPSAPGSEPMQSMGGRMMDIGMALGNGLITGGPIGMASAGVGEGMRGMGDIVNRGAYKAGGAATDIAAKAGLPPEIAGGIGYGTNVATQALPVLFGGALTKAAGEQPLEKTGHYLMQSALKPSKADLLSGKGQEAVDTMLREGANVSESGVQKLQDAVNSKNEAIAAALKGSTATVNKGKVASRLQDTVKTFENQVNPTSDSNSVERAYTEFLRHPNLGDEIPVQQAHQLKQGTYKMLGQKSYGELKGADIESQKALARGLKEDVAAAVPEVGQLNAEESKLINALIMARSRSLTEGNKNPVGLGWLAHHPGSYLAFAADRSAAFKSALARLLHSGAGTISATPGYAAAGAAETLKNSGNAGRSP